MKDYYQILGIGRQSSEEEIKRAFRRLAIAYHPDRNPSKEAEVFIKEVIEAYQILADPMQRAVYDSLMGENGSVGFPKLTRPHRDPHYRRQPPNPNYKSEKQLMMEMMRTYMPYALFVSWCTLAFSVVMIFDFWLPPVQQTEVITEIKNQSIWNETGKFRTDQGSEFKIDRVAAIKFKRGQSIAVTYSRWLKVPLFLKNDWDHEKVKIPATLYGNFIFAPLFLLMASLAGVIYRKGTMFRFNSGVVNFLLLILNILFLLIHHLHLP